MNLQSALQLMEDVLSCKENNLLSSIDFYSTESYMWNYIKTYGFFPSEAVFMGVAYDKTPILYQASKDSKYPTVFISDNEYSRLSFLKMIVRGINFRKNNDRNTRNIAYAVFTNKPEMWIEFNDESNAGRIIPIYHDSTVDALYSISGWANSTDNKRNSLIVLFDDMTKLLALDFDSLQIVKYLALHGTSKNVHLIGTIHPEETNEIQFFDHFRTRLYGKYDMNFKVYDGYNWIDSVITR